MRDPWPGHASHTHTLTRAHARDFAGLVGGHAASRVIGRALGSTPLAVGGGARVRDAPDALLAVTVTTRQRNGLRSTHAVGSAPQPLFQRFNVSQCGR